MSRPGPVNSVSTPGSISRRSGRASRPLEEGRVARSSSAGGTDANRGGNGGMSVVATKNSATAPPNPTPWKHPDELPFVLREDWTQELMIDYLAKKSFSIPPNIYRSKDPFFTVTPRHGQPVTIPRRYRIPLLFLAKFQWDSIRIALTARDPVADWNVCKYEIIHVSRVCQHFFEAARAAAEMKGPGALSRAWRCALIDRVLVRFWNHWFLSEESWIKAFHKEFDEEEYEQDILEKDWQRWALKGFKGFQLTKEEIANGITADQFMDGLTKTYSGWTWVIKSPEPADTPFPVSESESTQKPVRTPNGEQESSSPTENTPAVAPASQGTPQITREQLEQLIRIATASSVATPFPSEEAPPQAVTNSGALKASSSVAATTVPAMLHDVSTANVGDKRPRDDADVDMDKQTKKAKQKSTTPEPSSSVAPGLPVTDRPPLSHQSQDTRKLSSSIDTALPSAPLASGSSSTINGQTLPPVSVANRALTGAHGRAHSVESAGSSLSNLSSSRRSASNTPPPQAMSSRSMSSSLVSGTPAKSATPVPLHKNDTPKAPWNGVSATSHSPIILTIPPFYPEGLDPAGIDRNMSVSPIVRSAASSGASTTITGAVPAPVPNSQTKPNGITPPSDTISGESSTSLSSRVVSKAGFAPGTPVPAPMAHIRHAAPQPHHAFATNSSSVLPSPLPSQNMSTNSMATSYSPIPTLYRTPALAAASIQTYPSTARSPLVSVKDAPSDHSALQASLQKSTPLSVNGNTAGAPLTGPDMNLMNLTNSTGHSPSTTKSAFTLAGVPDPDERTQQLHASLLIRDLIDFVRTSSWRRQQALAPHEREPVVDARTRHLVLDGANAMSVDQRFVILKNSVLSIVNRFDDMKGEDLERELATVDSKLKYIFDETWSALSLPRRDQPPFKRTTRDADVQAVPDIIEVVPPPKPAVSDAGVQASVEPIRRLLESVSIQTEVAVPEEPSSPPSRPSVSPDATMIDLTAASKEKNAEEDVSVKAAMVSMMDMMHDFVESTKKSKGKERDDSTDSPLLATIMAEFRAMKDDLKKAQKMNREELQAINEIHRNEVRSLKEEIRLGEQQRKVELETLKSQHRSEVEALKGTIRTMEKERERLSASDQESAKIQPHELLDLRRRVTTLESLPRSPGLPSDHVMASPPLSAASTTRSEITAFAPKIQAHPLSHLLSIDGDSEETSTPFSPRTHMASMREMSASKPSTPLPSERGSTSRRESMDVADEMSIPMPVKTQRKPYMFASRPNVG